MATPEYMPHEADEWFGGFGWFGDRVGGWVWFGFSFFFGFGRAWLVGAVVSFCCWLGLELFFHVFSFWCFWKGLTWLDFGWKGIPGCCLDFWARFDFC